MTKTLSELELRREFLLLDTEYLKVAKGNIILNGEKLSDFPLSYHIGQDALLTFSLFAKS
jgi:hypothetical protein